MDIIYKSKQVIVPMFNLSIILINKTKYFGLCWLDERELRRELSIELRKI